MEKIALAFAYNKIALYLFIFLGWMPVKAMASPLTNVPLDHPVYQYLERASIKGFFDQPLPRSKPFSRRLVAELISELSEKSENELIKLSQVEARLLSKLRYEFASESESESEIDPKAPINNRYLPYLPYLWSLRKTSHEFNLDGWIGQSALTSRQAEGFENGYDTSIRLFFHGEVKNLGFHEELRASLLHGKVGRLPFAPNLLERYSSNSTLTTSIKASVFIDLTWFSLQVGRDNIYWGPGAHGTLIISDNPPPMDLVKLNWNYAPLKFISFLAWLDDDNKKYLVAHRLEVAFHRTLLIGITESLIGINKFRLQHLNPFLIYLVTDEGSEIGAQQNRFIFFDFNAEPIKNIKFYGEFMLDDFPIPPADWRYWGSKFGMLGGLYCADPFTLHNTDFQVEYALANQYAYTGYEEYPIRNYAHRNSSMGHWLGPDSDDLWVNLSHKISQKLVISSRYELERHGEGKIDKFRRAFDPDQWEFLSGIVESGHTVSIGVGYEDIERYFFKVELGLFWKKNVANQLNTDQQGQLFNIAGFYRF